MAVAEQTFSKFLQHPSEITSELSRGPVLLRRRDEEDLVVMTKGQNGALGTAIRAAAAAIVGGVNAAEAELPWLAFLTIGDRQRCLHEIARAAAGAMTSGQFTLLSDTLYSWEATGLAAWDAHNRNGDARYADEERVAVARPA